MPLRKTALTAVLAAAAVAAGVVPASAVAGDKLVPAGKSAERDSTSAPVLPGRPDGAGDGRKN